MFRSGLIRTLAKLLHLVQRGGAAAHPGPSALYQMYHQRPMYQSPYCCIMVRCSAVLMWS